VAPFNELALDDALDNSLLVFAGTEILSGYDLELVAAVRYRMSVVRGRYDTHRQAHAVGEEVFVIRRADLHHFVVPTNWVPYVVTMPLGFIFLIRSLWVLPRVRR